MSLICYADSVDYDDDWKHLVSVWFIWQRLSVIYGRCFLLSHFCATRI